MADGIRVSDKPEIPTAASFLGVDETGTAGRYPFSSVRDKIADYLEIDLPWWGQSNTGKAEAE